MNKRMQQVSAKALLEIGNGARVSEGMITLSSGRSRKIATCKSCSRARAECEGATKGVLYCNRVTTTA